MSFVQRGGGRLLARLVRGVSADTAACSTCPVPHSHLVIPTSLWSFSGVRRMAGGEEPSSRPPPPGSPASRGTDQPPPASAAPAPAASTAAAASAPPAPTSPASAPTPKPATGQPPPPASPSSSSSSSPQRPSSPSASNAPGPAAASARPASETTPSSGPAAAAAGVRKPKPSPKPDPDSGSREDEGSEPLHAHHDFWQDERVRKLQPMIEEGMRVTAYEGLQGTGSGLLRGPDRTWSFLYDAPTAALAAAAFAPLWSASVSAVRPLVIPPTEGMIRDQVDHSFDAKELAESVAAAVPVFYDAVVEADSEALSRMCTPQAVEAVNRDRRRLREERGLEVVRVDSSVRLATLGGGNLWGPESIRAFDPAWAGGSTDPNMSKSWLVAAVYLDVSMWVSYRRVGGGGDGGGGGGEGAEGRELRLPVRRWGTWMMARGPLPKGPAESLDCPWKLLAWY